MGCSYDKLIDHAVTDQEILLRPLLHLLLHQLSHPLLLMDLACLHPVQGGPLIQTGCVDGK